MDGRQESNKPFGILRINRIGEIVILRQGIHAMRDHNQTCVERLTRLLRQNS